MSSNEKSRNEMNRNEHKKSFGLYMCVNAVLLGRWFKRTTAATTTTYAMEINYIIEIFESFLFFLCVPGQWSAGLIESVYKKLPNERMNACVRVFPKAGKSCGWFWKANQPNAGSYSSHTVFTFLLLILHIQFLVFGCLWLLCIIALCVCVSLCKCLCDFGCCLSTKYSGSSEHRTRKERRKTKMCKTKQERNVNKPINNSGRIKSITFQFY